MLEIVISSRNKEKKRELKSLLKGLKIKVLDLNDFPAAPKVEEKGKTFEENAATKALTVARFTKRLTLADDSGLEVEALGGRPGVYSARFAGENATYEVNNRKLLRALERIPNPKRKAKFVCVIAIADKNKLVGLVRGECIGRITFEPKGRNGFGYDPVFFSPKYNKTFAQLSSKEKNSVSHRGRALKKAKVLIQGCL
ncbi:MAG: XTP/dITP diphosphatase [Candidatus Omnitrophota bacterium]|nr:XTP/dITP diphosphatase [Candidatus Omnitrophota bacterium]